MGPPPFRFSARQPGQAVPAFSVPFKLLATVIVLACAAGFAQAWYGGKVSGGTGGGWFLAGLALMGYTGWHILRSKTWIDETGLHQSWVWDKHMDLRELAYARLIRVRGLDWLIAPRIYVRTLMGKFAVFYAASPAMIEEFERLARELSAFRGQR